ncbi:hypothetical protein FHU28_005208 [Micromonospora echinospora]|uniref:Uncharacterized protein n=1 Tax=Micromonospora echinospora TaxID=1877 RepID=A0ABR6MJW0_MICEC|nr:hypothetical protein [Micromonospora echinospora]
MAPRGAEIFQDLRRFRSLGGDRGGGLAGAEPCLGAGVRGGGGRSGRRLRMGVLGLLRRLVGPVDGRAGCRLPCSGRGLGGDCGVGPVGLSGRRGRSAQLGLATTGIRPRRGSGVRSGFGLAGGDGLVAGPGRGRGGVLHRVGGPGVGSLLDRSGRRGYGRPVGGLLCGHGTRVSGWCRASRRGLGRAHPVGRRRAGTLAGPVLRRRGPSRPLATARCSRATRTLYSGSGRAESGRSRRGRAGRGCGGLGRAGVGCVGGGRARRGCVRSGGVERGHSGRGCAGSGRAGRGRCGCGCARSGHTGNSRTGDGWTGNSRTGDG